MPSSRKTTHHNSFRSNHLKIIGDTIDGASPCANILYKVQRWHYATSMLMRELDVRLALHKTYVRRIVAEHPNSLVVDELGLFEGKYRIDVAVINGKLHGYEIKSRMDNLDRLPTQQESYSRLFDRMTLVADERHVEKAVEIVPPWWGLIAVSVRDGAPYLNEIWPSRQNLNVEPHALCQLLWRDEALQVLKDLGLATGSIRSRSRTLMWKVLAQVLEPEELKNTVHRVLKAREGWRKNDWSAN